MGAITIPTQRHTAVVIITEVTVIIMQRLTTTPPRALTAGNRLLMAPTARRRAEPLTIHTLARTREAPAFRLPMAFAVRHRPTILIPGPLHRTDKVRDQTVGEVLP